MIRTDVHIMRIYLAVMHERGQLEAANTHSMVQLLGRRVVNRSLFSPSPPPPPATKKQQACSINKPW